MFFKENLDKYRYIYKKNIILGLCIAKKYPLHKQKFKMNLSNPKDKLNDLSKAIIYEINRENYGAIYLGQTRRNVKTRLNEYFPHLKYQTE